MVQQIYSMQGRSEDRRGILNGILEFFPSNKIVRYALITTYPALKRTIMSTEREDIMMNNPDIVVFWPFMINSFTQEFQEDFEERWGMGRNPWPGSSKLQPPSKARQDQSDFAEKLRNENKGSTFGLGLGDLNPFD